MAGKIWPENDWRSALLGRPLPSVEPPEGLPLPGAPHLRYGGPWPAPPWDRPSAAVLHRMGIEWLRAADALFVWIDAPDPYGTLVEVGVAHGLGKPVFLAYSTDLDRKVSGQMWFAGCSAECQTLANSPEDAWYQFLLNERHLFTKSG